MKNRSLATSLIRSLCGSSLAYTAALGLGLFTTASYAQISPVGPTWDCLLSGGGQRGIVFLTFQSDGSFSGHEMIVPKLDTTSTSGGSDDGRGGVDTGRGGDAGRTGTSVGSGGSSTNSSGVVTNLFGSGPIEDGLWTMDSKGKITGAYIRHTSAGDQPVSFRGKVRKGSPRNLVLVANNVQTISGFRQTTVTNMPQFDGTTWDGFKFLNNLPFPEVFMLTGAGQANLYFMSGTGGGYTYSSGVCMVSIQKKIGFTVREESGTNSLLRATIGPFQRKGFNTGNAPNVETKGIIEPFDEVVFKAQLRP